MKTKKRSLVKAEGEAFTEALNAATIEDLERALRFKGLPTKKRTRIQAALDNKRKPKTETSVGAPLADQPKAAPKRKAKAERPARQGDAAASPAKARKPSGLDAAVAVLAEAGKPMNTKAIVERMLSTGLWKTNGKTPAATIYAAIIREVAAKGDKSRFRKTDRGMFELTAVGKEVK
jgi:hypothetical protein